MPSSAYPASCLLASTPPAGTRPGGHADRGPSLDVPWTRGYLAPVSERRPLIGISACLDEGRIVRPPHDYVYVHQGYVDVVEAAGATPIVVPVTTRTDVLDTLDGLVVTGGDDIPPHYFGAAPAPDLHLECERRVDADLRLLRRALQRGMPVLGVCYGLQLLNVLCGGTLVQRLPRAPLDHGAPGQPRSHDVTVVPESLLARLCSAGTLPTTGGHRQGIARLGAHLVASAIASDGLIEAIEHSHAPVLAVQWHPERSPQGARLFAGLARGRFQSP